MTHYVGLYHDIHLRLAICAAVICVAQIERTAEGQGTESADWANAASQLDEHGVSPGVDVTSRETSTSTTVATAPARTPIDRERTADPRSSGGDARRPSWSWTWLPIAIAAALWWLVGRMRRGRSLDQSLLPEGVIAPLGRQGVGGGQSVQLIRIGSRILVVTPTAEGLRTLTEITEAQEVERLVALCLQPQQGMAGIGNLFSRPIRSIADSERPQQRASASSAENSHGSQPIRAGQSQAARVGHASADRPEVAP